MLKSKGGHAKLIRIVQTLIYCVCMYVCTVNCSTLFPFFLKNIKEWRIGLTFLHLFYFVLHTFSFDNPSDQPHHHQGHLCCAVIWQSPASGYVFEEQPNNTSSCLGLTAAVVCLGSHQRLRTNTVPRGCQYPRVTFDAFRVCVCVKFKPDSSKRCTVGDGVGRRIWQSF